MIISETQNFRNWRTISCEIRKPTPVFISKNETSFLSSESYPKIRAASKQRLNAERKQAERKANLYLPVGARREREKIKDRIGLILDDWPLRRRRICREETAEITRLAYLPMPRFTLHYRKQPLYVLYKYKSNKWRVAFGLGYRFSYSVLFMTWETERKRGRKRREGERLIHTNLHSWATRPLEFLTWSTFESLTGCAPYGNTFTMELTIGLQHSSAVDITRNSSEISIPGSR